MDQGARSPTKIFDRAGSRFCEQVGLRLARPRRSARTSHQGSFLHMTVLALVITIMTNGRGSFRFLFGLPGLLYPIKPPSNLIEHQEEVAKDKKTRSTN